MTVEKKGHTQWLCLGKSIRGAFHERSGLPNQDAISWWTKKAESPLLGEGPPLILAVSDGHGSKKNFRSDVGSQKAVVVATRVIRDFFLEGESDQIKLSTIKDKAQNLLPQRLAHEWKQSVEQDWERNPITEEEWERVLQERGATARQAIEENPSIAYGATLLAVLVTNCFILYLQLGDGDILCVDSSGKTTRPLERDPRLIANETTSLCATNAWQEFRVGLVAYQKSPTATIPALILVATDGYANSYVSEEEFIKIGRDYYDMTNFKGIEYVAQRLEEFLKETSLYGSGDDITLGLAKRVEKKVLDDITK
ncbi:MAG: PP2C family serine/threonine-protein phosphatase [Xenococcaceae cyanobacterium]